MPVRFKKYTRIFSPARFFFRHTVVGVITAVLCLPSASAQKDFDILTRNYNSHKSFNTQSKIVSSREDMAVVAWLSAREGTSWKNVYAQKINSDGTFLWEGDGTPVCPWPANQDNFSLVDDDFGGVIAVWEDYRLGTDQPRIYAQRLNLRGEPMWGNGGIRICENESPQRKPCIVADKQTGFFVIWEDDRRGSEESDVYGQHINLSGKLNWMGKGLPIVTAQGLQKNFTITSDEDQNLYILWEDFRNGRYWNLFAQKLDHSGAFFWTPGGLDIFAGVMENQHNPAIVPDGYGGLVFVFQKYSDETRGYDIYRGRIKNSGELEYNFATCYSADDQVNPSIAKKGSSVIIAWEDRRHGNWDIYAHQASIATGLLSWQNNGAPVIQTTAEETRPFILTSAMYNHQYVVWQRYFEGKYKMMVQQLDNFGVGMWDESGVAIALSEENQSDGQILESETGGLWACWTDDSRMDETPVKYQRINASRARLRSPEGVSVTGNHSGPSKIQSLQIMASSGGYFFLVWEDFRNHPTEPDIYIQKVDATGKQLWRFGGLPVCIAKGEQSRPVLVEDGAGGIIIAWVDARKGEDDIYAQRISESGKYLWDHNGVLVCDAPRGQSGLRAVSDNREGIVLCWVDARNINSTGFDLYIQRMNETGEPLWGRNGKSFTSAEGLQSSPSLAPDDKGGAFIAWMDNRAGVTHIYVQHINDYGIYEWDYGGRLIAEKDEYQRYPEIQQNVFHDLYMVWEDARYGEGFEKIYMQSMSPGGMLRWGMGGKIACQLAGRQLRPRMAQDNGGDLWIAWMDGRAFSQDYFQLVAQRFDVNGNPKWHSTAVSIGDRLKFDLDYSLSVDGEGNSYFIWNQEESGKRRHAYVQKLNGEGLKQFSLDGISLGSEAQDQLSPSLAIGKDGSILAAWISYDPQSGAYGIMGRRL